MSHLSPRVRHYARVNTQVYHPDDEVTATQRRVRRWWRDWLRERSPSPWKVAR